MSPEMLTSKMYNPMKNDSFSLGVVAFLMFTGEHAFGNESEIHRIGLEAHMQKIDRRQWAMHHLVASSTNLESLLAKLLEPKSDLRLKTNNIFKEKLFD